MTPKKHGGARIGAGRKKRAITRTAVTIKFEPHDALRLKQICKAKKITQVGYMTNKIRRDKI